MLARLRGEHAVRIASNIDDSGRLQSYGNPGMNRHTFASYFQPTGRPVRFPSEKR